MRHSVLLAVCLGLVLSLLKESAAQETINTASVTPTSRTTRKEQSPQAAPSWNRSRELSSPREASPGSSPREDKDETAPKTTTQSPTTTAPKTTTQIPTTSAPKTTTLIPTTSAPKTTTQIPTTSAPKTTTQSPTTSAPKTTTLIPTTSAPKTTTQSPTTSAPKTTTQIPTTTADNSTSNETAPETTPSPPTSAPGTTPSPTTSVDFCLGDPCGRNLATCVSLNSSYTCVCQYGFYYENENCYRGKVFPATISVNAIYTDSLQDVNSTEYEDMFNNLSKFFRDAFANLKGYVETVIIEIQRPNKSRNSVPLNVKVTNLFTRDSPEDIKAVSSAVQEAIEKGNQPYVKSYTEAKHCDVYQCDTKTTVCEEGTLPECKCKPDLEKTKWDDRSCSACSESCSAAKHKYCVKEEDVPTCKCMANFKNKFGDCVPCPVGYSGENCRDNTELILIIVGTVFGAIILSLVIAVSVISVRAKHQRSPEKRSLIKSGHTDRNTSDDRPSMFPRVQTTSGHANPGYQHNPYEMSYKNRDRFPERDYDDLYEASREPRGFRGQSRY